MKQPKVSDWVKKEKNIQELYSKNPAVAASLHHVNWITHEEADKALSMWVCQALKDGITVIGDVIQEKWQHFAQMLQIPEDQWPTLSEGWLTKFKE